jgi:uroporphyrinogen-III synthase
VKLLIIRPQPGADATAARARAAGHQPILLPLFEIQPVAWDLPSLAPYDALLLTSGNAVRQLGDAAQALHMLPVYAVGLATAKAAQASGFTATTTGDAGVMELLERAHAAGHGHLLWLAGEDRTDFPVPVGMMIDTRVVYRSTALPAPDRFAAIVRSVDAILLHSPRAAAHFAGLCRAESIERHALTIAALSPAIAEKAGAEWQAVVTAAAPNDAALLSALQSYFTNVERDP